VKPLHETWLVDKQLAFSASVLIGTDLNDSRIGAMAGPERATEFIAAKLTNAATSHLSDSTLALLDKIPDDFREPNPELLTSAVSLSSVLSYVSSEIELRTNNSKRVPEILISHVVYLLKHSQLSLRDLLKWLRRHREKGKEAESLVNILRVLESDRSSMAVCDLSLDACRDTTQQTRDRIEAVDSLYDAFLANAGNSTHVAWWLRICLALRSSLYCWPLMVGGSQADDSYHGISLPIGLFLSQDGKSRIYFKIVNPGGGTDRRRYVPRSGRVWAHMEGSGLQWNAAWAEAIRVGVDVAKILWRTQNGRLRFVDEATSDAMLNASLVVDVGAACAIVDEIYGGSEEEVGPSYALTGRSAEAYWVQAVLGLLLPGREIPLGVVTGKVEDANGAFEVHHVEGIAKKLEYANNAGFSRIVLPGQESIEGEDESTAPASGVGQVAGAAELTSASESSMTPSAILSALSSGAGARSAASNEIDTDRRAQR
jgi:hypothetical protein